MLAILGIAVLCGLGLVELGVYPPLLWGLAIASVVVGQGVRRCQLNYAMVLGGTCLVLIALLWLAQGSRLWVNGAWWLWAWGCAGFLLKEVIHKVHTPFPQGRVGIRGKAIASYGLSASGLFVVSEQGIDPAFSFAQAVPLIVAINLFIGGIVSYSGWYCWKHDLEKKFSLHLEGIWGMEADYEIDLKYFSRIDQVKIAEVEDIHWLQLEGYNRELTLPLALTGNAEMEQNFIAISGLAKTARCLDSLALANILLPQGASILAGLVLILLGVALLWSLPIDLPDRYLLPLLWSVGMVSPSLGRVVLHLVAPVHLQKVSPPRVLLRCWEVGVLVWLGLCWLAYPQAMEPFIGVSLGSWVLATGICVLALVRRTPILTQI